MKPLSPASLRTLADFMYARGAVLLSICSIDDANFGRLHPHTFPVGTVCVAEVEVPEGLDWYALTKSGWTEVPL